MPVAEPFGLAVTSLLATEMTSLIGVAEGIEAPAEGNATTLLEVLFALF